jgi:hypothetical protein
LTSDKARYVNKRADTLLKIAGLFSGESPMSLKLTTTHENGIFRGVSGRFVGT